MNSYWYGNFEWRKQQTRLGLDFWKGINTYPEQSVDHDWEQIFVNKAGDKICAYIFKLFE